MAGYADFITEKGKGLFSHENKPFCVPFGGDKRDRTADLLNAIYSPDMLVGRFHYRIDTLLPIDFTGKKGH